MTKKTKKLTKMQKKMKKEWLRYAKKHGGKMLLLAEMYGQYEPTSPEVMKACADLLHSRLVVPRSWPMERVKSKDIVIPLPLPSYNDMADARVNQMLDDAGIKR